MKQGEEKRNASLRGRAVRQKRRKEGGGAIVGGSGEATQGERGEGGGWDKGSAESKE